MDFNENICFRNTLLDGSEKIMTFIHILNALCALTTKIPIFEHDTVVTFPEHSIHQ